jgi:NADH:ubiquinone oxidoreductase subunit E
MKKDKIEVVVCTGTACFIMGGAEILMLEEHLPENLRECVEIRGTTCMDYCKDVGSSKPPFVEIDGDVVSEASLPKILQILEEVSSKR